jgi:hypothetical protein
MKKPVIASLHYKNAQKAPVAEPIEMVAMGKKS